MLLLPALPMAASPFLIATFTDLPAPPQLCLVVHQNVRMIPLLIEMHVCKLVTSDWLREDYRVSTHVHSTLHRFINGKEGEQPILIGSNLSKKTSFLKGSEL